MQLEMTPTRPPSSQHQVKGEVDSGPLGPSRGWPPGWAEELRQSEHWGGAGTGHARWVGA